ncbi:MAG: flagellar motor protein MotB [Clostridium sp.]|uniref:OmpA/MotB family protein n=1 Tax=Clostridium sp. TaxID=1506 RepID=UPI0029129026|nr:flagellar motor protein MotB [Clostridium sp.]MDU7339061.1 flagellar motor protein MotB [Clostridium sp.]
MARRKRKGEAEAPENNERWLLTYSDMITLLLALFMILYSMSSIDAKKFAKMAEEAGHQMGAVTSDATGGGGGGSGGSGNGAGTGSGTEATNASNLTNKMDALDEVYSILQSYVEKNHLEDQIGLVNTNTYVKIHLKDKMMFVPDSSRMLPESEPVLKEVSDAISKVYDRVDHITFSGHTADVGPHTLSGDQTSWRLSTERAVTVVTRMIGYGMKQDKISIEGYAHFSPVANNNNEEGRAKNRRVEITILKNPPIIPADISKPAADAASSNSQASGQTESSKAAH